MGELRIHRPQSEEEARAFSRAVVQDIRALDALIARGGIETGVTRMGVEQEMYLVGGDCRAAPCAGEVLERITDRRFTTELARFNLEANFDPHLLTGSFLAQMERELNDALGMVSRVAAELGARVLLTGILPTLRHEDVGIRNLTPALRYEYLNQALFRGREAITIVIDGIDQYEGRHDSVVLEGANTSLQLHLQVTPENSARQYNLMQLITAPLLAAATNSPVLLGHRLWHETRVAVFERSLDERTGAQLSRGFPTRVSFGQDWLKDSIVEIFRDNAARFPVILSRDLVEDSQQTVARGEAPKLAALALHNGTVWRWNRPCYGVAKGVAHLRIENRVLPAGPSVVDEVANAALFYGMMAALPEEYGDVAAQLPFRDAKTNFLAAARQGLAAEFAWRGGRRTDARTLLLEELLPAARQGLQSLAVPDEQVERYLGIVQARVEGGQTGSGWLLNSFQAHRGSDADAVWRGTVSAMLAEQQRGRPVHEWDLAEPLDMVADDTTTLGTIMTTDLFTLKPDDVVDLASGVMEWKRIRHIPVEDGAGQLVGILTARDLLGVGQPGAEGAAPAVGSLMSTEFTAVPPELGVIEALPLMLASDLGALLVVTGGRLVGIVTERDMLRSLSGRLTVPPQAQGTGGP